MRSGADPGQRVSLSCLRRVAVGRDVPPPGAALYRLIPLGLPTARLTARLMRPVVEAAQPTGAALAITARSSTARACLSEPFHQETRVFVCHDPQLRSSRMADVISTMRDHTRSAQPAQGLVWPHLAWLPMSHPLIKVGA